MTPVTPTDALTAVIERHFHDPSRTARLEVGQVLLRQGDMNRRLYRVRNGLVSGSIEDAHGEVTQVMHAGPGDLVGVQSFFSGEHRSFQTVVALEATELGYIERDMPITPGEPSLERLLMPIVLSELIRRQRAALEMAERERQTRQRLDQLERVSALGQLAAGVAHELNNALAVLVRGTAWIAQMIQKRIDAEEKVLHRAFDAGLLHGRTASAAEVRQRAPVLQKRYGISAADARRLAATGLADSQLASFNQLKEHVERVNLLWELGATIHDMRLASDQSEHVIRSMRDLGVNHGFDQQPVDVNDSIHTALKILRGQLQQVEVVMELADRPILRGSFGKLVQVWTNIIKNAVEAMTATGTPSRRPVIRIVSRLTPTDVIVTLDDSGPGIPPQVLPQIFEPSFTTKKQGLSFGLGLGLSIVQRLVSEHGGDVEARNTDAGARFTVRLPREVLP